MIKYFMRALNRIIPNKPPSKKIDGAEFNLWDEVWIFEKNMPVKVRIVSVKIFGAYDQFIARVNPVVEYRVANIDYFSDYFGFDIKPDRIYKTRQDLIDSLQDYE